MGAMVLTSPTMNARRFGGNSCWMSWSKVCSRLHIVLAAAGATSRPKFRGRSVGVHHAFIDPSVASAIIGLMGHHVYATWAP